MMRTLRWPIWITLLLLALGNLSAQDEPMNAELDAKFLLPNAQILFIVGQDLGAIGGMTAYNDGYHDHVDRTAGGVTTYTDIATLQATIRRERMTTVLDGYRRIIILILPMVMLKFGRVFRPGAACGRLSGWWHLTMCGAQNLT